MLKIGGFFISVLLVCLFYVSNAQNTWKESFYDKYSYTNYSTLPSMKKTINTDNIDISLINAAIFYETNRQRAINGKSIFKYNAKLAKAAQDHSDDMVNLNFYSHTSLIPEKETPEKRLQIVGLIAVEYAENINFNYILKLNNTSFFPPSEMGDFYLEDGKTKVEKHTYSSFAVEVVDSWMKSEGHRLNILDMNFNFLGCGSAFYYDGTGIDKIPAIKCTQCFARIK